MMFAMNGVFSLFHCVVNDEFIIYFVQAAFAAYEPARTVSNSGWRSGFSL